MKTKPTKQKAVVAIIMDNVPSDYVKINSGLGEAAPANIVTLPVLFEGNIKAVIELASFEPFTENQMAFLDQLTESIGIVINTIEANMNATAVRCWHRPSC